MLTIEINPENFRSKIKAIIATLSSVNVVFLQDPLLFASIKSARIAEQAVIAARAYIRLVEKMVLCSS